jgi:hypothetical protein
LRRLWKRASAGKSVQHRQVKYLNNPLAADYGALKRPSARRDALGDEIPTLCKNRIADAGAGEAVAEADHAAAVVLRMGLPGHWRVQITFMTPARG